MYMLLDGRNEIKEKYVRLKVPIYKKNAFNVKLSDRGWKKRQKEEETISGRCAEKISSSAEIESRKARGEKAAWSYSLEEVDLALGGACLLPSVR